MQSFLQLEIALQLVLLQLVAFVQRALFLLFYLLVTFFFHRHHLEVLLVFQRVVLFFVLVVQFGIYPVSDFARVDFYHRRNLPFH